MKIASQPSYAGGFHQAGEALEPLEAKGPQGMGRTGCVSLPRPGSLRSDLHSLESQAGSKIDGVLPTGTASG